MSDDMPVLAVALRNATDRVSTRVRDVRRHLHAHPELAFQETATAALVAKACRDLGMTVRTGVGGTGVLADLAGDRPGSSVLVRADMDALPVQEGDDSRSYRSTVPGVMHACGHDGHVAVALGVAEVLTTLRSQWNGRLRMCFQPAEETDEGAERMIDDGALDGIDRAVGIHLQAGLQTGTVAVGAGVQWASSDELRLTFRGRGGHAGSPAGAVNPIEAAARFVVDLGARTASLVTRRPVVATIAQLRGGEAANVTPEVAHLAGTLRALDEGDRRMLLDEVQALTALVAGEHDAKADLVYGAHCPALSCDPGATAVVQAALTESDSPAVVVAAEPSTAADDMARYLREVTGCYFRVGASDSAVSPVHPHHHPLFDIDERALPVGVYCLARAAIALLADPATR